MLRTASNTMPEGSTWSKGMAKFTNKKNKIPASSLQWFHKMRRVYEQPSSSRHDCLPCTAAVVSILFVVAVLCLHGRRRIALMQS